MLIEGGRTAHSVLKLLLKFQVVTLVKKNAAAV